jgi:hypothetical protein
MWWIAAALASREADFDAAIARMLTEIAQVRDAEFDLHQVEWVGGKLQPPAVMHVKWRPRNDVVMTWDNGQTLHWVPSVNPDKMRVDPPYMFPIWLSPDGAAATHGQRHTVRRMGLVPVGDLFAADRARMQADPTLAPSVVDLGSVTIYGEPSHCFDATMRKDREPALYAARVEVCVSVATGLPVRMRCWDHEDGALRMVEEYGYANLRVNVGLTDADFTP